MKTFQTACLVGIGMCALAPTARAQGIPTFDAQEALANARQIINQIQQIDETIRNGERLVRLGKTAIEQRDALTGVTIAGQLLNSGVEKDLRRYIPASLEETLQILEAGGNPGSLDSLKRIFQEKEEAYQIATGEEVGVQGPNDPTAVAHERNRRTTLAAAAVAEVAFDQTADRIARMEFLLEQLENSPTSKTTADLGIRVAVENGFAIAEAVRLLSTELSTQTAVNAERLVEKTKLERAVTPDPTNDYPSIQARLRSRASGTFSETQFASQER